MIESQDKVANENDGEMIKLAYIPGSPNGFPILKYTLNYSKSRKVSI